MEMDKLATLERIEKLKLEQERLQLRKATLARTNMKKCKYAHGLCLCVNTVSDKCLFLFLLWERLIVVLYSLCAIIIVYMIMSIR